MEIEKRRKLSWKFDNVRKDILDVGYRLGGDVTPEERTMIDEMLKNCDKLSRSLNREKIGAEPVPTTETKPSVLV